MEDWDAHAKGWDEDPGARAYAASAFGSLRDVAASHDRSLDGARVLDFGCGTGLLTEHLVSVAAEVVAVDASAKMIEVLAAKVPRLSPGRVQAIHADILGAARPAALDAPFDFVVCSSVCAFLSDYPAAAAQLVQRLHPGGVFVQWDWEFNADDEEPFGLTREAVRTALTAAGLEEIAVGDGFTLDMGMVMTPLCGNGRRPA